MRTFLYAAALWLCLDSGYDYYFGTVGVSPTICYQWRGLTVTAGAFCDQYSAVPIISLRYELKLWGQNE